MALTPEDLLHAVRHYYIDDTDVTSDNRDVFTTELTYKDEPEALFIVDTRFALWLVENALENADRLGPLHKMCLKFLEDALNKE